MKSLNRSKITFLFVFVLLAVAPIGTAFGYPPAGVKVTVVDWTYFKNPGHDVDAYFNLKLQWIEDGETMTEWVPAFCLDSGIYWNSKPEMVVIPSNSPNLPTYALDENLDAINYLMDEWKKGTWPSATWKEIQWVIWYYSDVSDPTGGGVYPEYDQTIYNQIINDIDSTDLSNFNGPYTVQILDPGEGDIEDYQNDWQMTFFIIPEVPLGTIMSSLAMIGGLVYKKKH